MPRRSNLFQDVVAIIHRHMAEGATVEDPGMLTDRLTGDEREVDVVIRSEAAGYEVIVGVEASATKRPAGVQWVDRMIGTHQHLPTDKLVLVSESGFWKTARRRAERTGVVAIAPEDLEPNDPAHKIVNRLRSIWPKTVRFTPREVKICVHRPEGVKWFSAGWDYRLFLEDGTEFSDLDQAVQGVVRTNFPSIAEQIDLANIAESTERVLVVGVTPPWMVQIDGKNQDLFLRHETDSSEFDRVESWEVAGKATIEVNDVSLTHKRLGDVMYAYGEGVFSDRPSLLVATKSKQGEKVTVRSRP